MLLKLGIGQYILSIQNYFLLILKDAFIKTSLLGTDNFFIIKKFFLLSLWKAGGFKKDFFANNDFRLYYYKTLFKFLKMRFAVYHFINIDKKDIFQV